MTGPARIETLALILDGLRRHRSFVAEAEDRELGAAGLERRVVADVVLLEDDILRHQEDGEVQRHRRITGDVSDEDLPALGRQLVNQRSAEFGSMIDAAGAVVTIATARHLGRSIRIDNGLLAEHAGVNAGFAITADVDKRPDLRPDRRIDLATGFLDAFKLPFDFVETIVRDLGFRRPIGQFAFKLLDELVILGRKRFDARAFRFAKRPRGRVKLMKLTLEIVGNVGGRNRRHECEALGLREFGGGRLQLFAGKIFKKIDVDPVLVPLGGKEITLDAAACGDIGIATDEPRLGIVRLNRPVEDRTPDVVGLIAIIGGTHLCEHASLTIDVARHGIGLGDP